MKQTDWSFLACTSRGTIALLWLVLVSHLSAAGFEEDFSTDPLERGWRTFGQAQLFHWDAAHQQLEVTWDSSQPNSYFFHTLGTVLTKTDDIELRFDLWIDDLALGVLPDKPFTFELAVGLVRLQDATSTNFVRGSGSQSPNVMEFDYFPDSGFGATISPAIISSNNQFMTSFTFPLELTSQHLFHVEMSYQATNQTLSTLLQRDGQPVGPIKEVHLSPDFTDFRLDTLAISSYSDLGADGSILARGHVDNVEVTVPDPPAPSLHGAFKAGAWEVTFQSDARWQYSLERSEDISEWRPLAGAAVSGNGGEQTLRDEFPTPIGHGVYRVRLERP